MYFEGASKLLNHVKSTTNVKGNFYLNSKENEETLL